MRVTRSSHCNMDAGLGNEQDTKSSASDIDKVAVRITLIHLCFLKFGEN
jgi:hypothetical protein